MTARALQHIDLDAWLDREVGPRRSLCPGRETPTPFAQLWRSLELAPSSGDARATALCEVSEQIVRAIAHHYPDNVFWDLDRLVASLARRPDAAAIRRSGHRVEALMAGFGMHSEIRFRYVHDFTYGFDWAKWVARDPEARRGVGPFDEPFLVYLEERQNELIALIARDDETYGKLRDERPRNPFGFSRDPDDERLLHETLAAQGIVPVQTWTLSGEPRWGEHFARVRNEVAERLGLST